MIEIIILIIATAHFSNWITWKLGFPILLKLRALGKPFNCPTCFSFWLGLIVFGIFTASIWAIPYAIITSLIADLIEENLNKFS